MLVFGIDIPLIEIILAFSIIIFIIMIEAIIIIGLLLNQLNKAKKLGELIEKLSEILLAIKKVEIDELDHIRALRK